MVRREHGWVACVWPSCSFSGFDGSPGAWRAWFFTSTDGLFVRVAKLLFTSGFDELPGARRAWLFTSIDEVPVCAAKRFLHNFDGLPGASRARFVASTAGLPVWVAKLFLSAALMGCLEPGVRGSSRALMGCLCACVWPDFFPLR